MRTYTLGKEDRLKSVVRIEKLFKTGKSFMTFPFIVYYTLEGAENYPKGQMMVSVSKHYFKHAVDRNRMKRLTREAFRLRKPTLNETIQKPYSVAFVYKSRQLESFEVVSKAMDAIMQKLSTVLV